MKKTFIVVLFCLIFISIPAYSEITATIVGSITNTGAFGLAAAQILQNINSIIYDYSVTLNSIAPFVTDSFAISIVNSMPIGVKKIKNFTFGFAINPAASFSKIDFWNTDNQGAAGSVPKAGVGVNVSLFGGISLGERFDLYFSGSYVPAAVFDAIKYKPQEFTLSIMSVGTKLRYVLLNKNKKKTNDFAGIAISPGLFFGYNKLNYNKTPLDLSANYDTGITNGFGTPPTFPGVLQVTDAGITTKIYVLTLDVEISFFFSFFKILNVYVSVGGSLNFSWMQMDGRVGVSNTITTYTPAATPMTETGFISITGKTSGSQILPRVSLGLEFNLFVRIILQGTASWSKGQGLYSGTFAIRFEF